MAKNKNEIPSSKDNAGKDAQAKEAKQKLKQAEKAKAPGAKGDKEKDEKADKKKASVRFRRFWKDFRGELKKIVWPDLKTIAKNTGIVLLTTVIIGVPVWILDYALSEGILVLKRVAQGARVEQVEPTTDYVNDYLSEWASELAEQAIPTTTAAPTEAEHDHNDPDHTH
ncbi:MAG: preprotein translocase subunit SecE [Oscillospiraceae bacterium]|nr:preprotein translocase subunit SecE [Oscillospiraceae bacterium]